MTGSPDPSPRPPDDETSFEFLERVSDVLLANGAVPNAAHRTAPPPRPMRVDWEAAVPARRGGPKREGTRGLGADGEREEEGRAGET